MNDAHDLLWNLYNTYAHHLDIPEGDPAALLSSNELTYEQHQWVTRFLALLNVTEAK